MHDKQSEILMLILVSTGMLLVFFILLVFFLMFYQKKKLLHKQELDQLKDKYEKEILRSQLEIQEQTFRNLSEEIHDNIGQVLSLVKLNIGTMDLSSPVGLQQKIDDSRTMIGKAIKDLRDLSKGLNTEYISEMGLERAIEHEMEMIKKTGVCETSLNIIGRKYRIETQHELILFRIVQEMLNNILKHAKASKIDLLIEYRRECIRISVEDNGKGLSQPVFGESFTDSGNGIKNMQHRARLIGAAFRIDSHRGLGTRVFLELPQPFKISEDPHVKI
jgi:two-component system NarL family sensor kinase